jgi:flagellar basal body P-ring formation protein FlgA
VPLVFRRGGLEIRAEGRALGRGGEGDSIRIMNLASRSTVTGWVTDSGEVHVTP